jgi:hypothetical protein
MKTNVSLLEKSQEPAAGENMLMYVTSVATAVCVDI